MRLGNPARYPFRYASILVALAVASCGGGDDSKSSSAKSPAGEMNPPSEEPGGPGGPGQPENERTPIPEGAIPVGDDLYMVPAGRDPSGCQQFTAWSATKAVTFVIYYRDRKGGFTANRAEADCS
jgi:hypothetical protein